MPLINGADAILGAFFFYFFRLSLVGRVVLVLLCLLENARDSREGIL